MEKYIVYGIYTEDTAQLVKVGRYLTNYPKSLERILLALVPGTRLEQLGSFEDSKASVNFLNKLKNPKKSPIEYTKIEKPQTKVRKQRVRFVEEHSATDKNGYLLYIQSYEGYTVVKI